MWGEIIVGLFVVTFIGVMIYANIDMHRILKPMTKEQRKTYLMSLRDPGE